MSSSDNSPKPDPNNAPVEHLGRYGPVAKKCFGFYIPDELYEKMGDELCGPVDPEGEDEVQQHMIRLVNVGGMLKTRCAAVWPGLNYQFCQVGDEDLIVMALNDNFAWRVRRTITPEVIEQVKKLLGSEFEDQEPQWYDLVSQ